MKGNAGGWLVSVLAIAALGFSYWVNVNDSLRAFGDPLVGEGLGQLCANAAECESFCHNQRGQCQQYCRINPSNRLCAQLFSR